MRALALLLLLAGCAAKPTGPAAPTASGGAPTTTTTPGADPAIIAEIERIEAAIKVEPNNMPYLYALALYYDRVHEPAKVIDMLKRLEALGWALGVGPDFPNTGTTPAFRELAARLIAREPEVHRASEAFRLPKARKIRSEGIAYDPVDDRFYFSGGAGMLLKVDRRGAIVDVPVDPVGRKFGRLGMDVDAGRRQLWAVSASFDPSADADERGRSGLSVYDLADGRLLRRVMGGSAEQPWFLNDMTLLADGTAFVTDTVRHAVVRLAPGAEAFEDWATGLEEPNGIVASPDGRTLYVADFRGINKFDLATRTRELLITEQLLHGIDGLIEHRGALIGIQNVLGSPRVVRVHVSQGNRVELLESRNPLLDVPATGVAAGDDYFFLANRSHDDADKLVLRVPLQ